MIISVLLTGCAGPQEPSSPWAAEIKAAQSQATTDFEREVLADGDITRQEYEEAVAKLVQCAADRGVVVTPIMDQDLYTYEVPTEDVGVADECSKGTTRLVEGLYSGMVRNPEKRDVFELEAECLRRQGVAPAEFTGQEWQRLIKQGDSTLFPFDVDDSHVQQCMVDPRNA